MTHFGPQRPTQIATKSNSLYFFHVLFFFLQVRERKRIHDAGGFIAFRGVWRVAGILATSRALGDYPLKDKNLVIANPDILTFDLNDHK